MLRPARLLGALGTVLVLTACAGGPAPEPGTGLSTEEPTAQQPQPALSITCDDILHQVTTVTGVDQGWTVLTGSGVGGTDYYGLAAATFRLSGGLECAWSAQASGSITVRILPDAAAQWLSSQKDLALFQPQRNAFGDGSYSTCMGSGCFVDVLQGDHWLQFAAALPKPELQALVAAVANQVSSAKGGEGVTAGPEWAIACDDVLPAAQRTTSLGGSLQLDKAVAPVQPVMLHAAIVRSAGGHCYWRGAIDGLDAALRIGIVPNAAGAWQQHFSAAPDPAYGATLPIVAPAGADEAFVGCQRPDTNCAVSVLGGDRWISVGVIRAAGGAQAAAESVAAYLVQQFAAR